MTEFKGQSKGAQLQVVQATGGSSVCLSGERNGEELRSSVPGCV